MGIGNLEGIIMKRVLALILETLQRFWIYLAALALLLALVYSLLSSRSDEPPELTKKNMQRALVKRPGHSVPPMIIGILTQLMASSFANMCF